MHIFIPPCCFHTGYRDVLLQKAFHLLKNTYFDNKMIVLLVKRAGKTFKYVKSHELKSRDTLVWIMTFKRQLCTQVE